MKKRFLIVAAVLTAFMATASLSAYPVSGRTDAQISNVADDPAAPVTRNFNLKGFTGIDVSGMVSVELTKSPDWKVNVTLPKELEEYLSVRVLEGELTISLNNVPKKGLLKFKNPEVKAEVSMPDLRSLEMSGATSLTCDDTFDLGKGQFEMELTGASKVKKLGVNADELYIEVGGASSVSLTGSFNEVEGEFSGAANCVLNIDAGKFTAEISGASKIYNSGTFGDIKAEASGASVFSVKGEASRMSLMASGAAKLETFECETSKADLIMSGASYCEINAVESLKVNLSGASSLRYKDNPDVNVTTGSISRAASIQKVK